MIPTEALAVKSEFPRRFCSTLRLNVSGQPKIIRHIRKTTDTKGTDQNKQSNLEVTKSITGEEKDH